MPTMLDEKLMFEGREIAPGQSWRPFPGDDYAVTYLRIERTGAGEVLVLEDCCGQFTRPVRDLLKENEK